METVSIMRNMQSDRPSHEAAARKFFVANPAARFVTTDGTMDTIVWRRIGSFMVRGDFSRRIGHEARGERWHRRHWGAPSQPERI